MSLEKVKSICRYIKRLSGRYKQPELFINLTYSCPLRCKYCYVNYSKDNDFTDEELFYLFEEGVFKLPYIKLVTFFGGEPLVKVDLIKAILDKYYQQLVDKGIHIAVITSLSINKDKHFEMMKKYPLYETIISFDNYAGKRVYANGKPFKVLEHIDLAELQQYRRNLCFHTVIDNIDSIKDLQYLQTLYKDYGFLYSWCWNKTPTQSFAFKDEYLQVLQNISQSDYKPLQYTKEVEAYLTHNQVGCGIGSELFVSCNGILSPCSISHHNDKMLLMKDGKVNDEAFEIIEQLETNVFNNEKCEVCGLKGFCNGGCLVERLMNRNENSVNPSLCQIMAELHTTYQAYFDSLSEDDIKQLNQSIVDNNLGIDGYCHDVHINMDMYDAFNIRRD